MAIPIFQISVNLSTLVNLEKKNEEFKSALQGIVQSISSMALQEWHTQANIALKSAGKYIAGLDETPQYPFDGNQFHARIENHEDFAFFLEYGSCVLYSPRVDVKRQPKVFTENGWVPCSLVKEGDFVLNKDGKFTRVIKVHNNDLYQGIQLKIIKQVNRKIYKNTLYERNVSLAQCPTCGYLEENFNNELKYRLCPECYKKIKIVKILVRSGGEPRRKVFLFLTEDHPVLTSKGYIRASKLKITDKVALFFDKKCEECERPIPSCNRFCSVICRAKKWNSKMLDSGKHFTQQFPEKAKIQQINNREKAKVKSYLEEAFYKYFKPYGYKIKRQHPVKITKTNGRTGVYWLDFYLPKYKIGIELDGSAWHNKERDKLRDGYILKQKGITVIRISDIDWRKDYKKCIRKIIRRLSNHDDLFTIEYRPIKHIQIVKPTNGFSLTTRFDLTVEEGSSFICQEMVIHNSPYDMKKMLSTSAKVRISKDGKRYLVIPFTHSKASLNTAGLGKEAQSLSPSRKQVPTIADPRSVAWGEHLSDMGDFGRQRKLFSVIGEQFAKERAGQKGVMTYYRKGSAFASGVDYQWKASKFEGIVRMVDHKGKTSEYVSFRVMSENSPANSWIHPGIRASHIAENTANIIRPQFQEAVGKLVKDSFSRTDIS